MEVKDLIDNSNFLHNGKDTNVRTLPPGPSSN
jgi:hypothetical protein